MKLEATMVDSQLSLIVRIIKTVQQYGPHTVEVLGKTYEISEDVFNPKFFGSSRFMAENISVTSQDEVLDMGTGCGIIAITAAQCARRVVAIDINPQAVHYAQKNVRLHGLENTVLVLEGNLFSPLEPGAKFDVILVNPPYFEGTPTTPLEYALFDPGNRFVRTLMEHAGDYLKRGGYLQLLLSTMSAYEHVQELMIQLGWEYQVMATKRLNGPWSEEMLFVYKLVHQ